MVVLLTLELSVVEFVELQGPSWMKLGGPFAAYHVHAAPRAP
jgi:hypothetical protein